MISSVRIDLSKHKLIIQTDTAESFLFPLLLLFSIYTDFPLVIGDKSIPGITSLIMLPFLILAIYRRITKADLFLFFAIGVILTSTSIAGSTFSYSGIGGWISKLFQSGTGIILGICLLKMFLALPFDKLISVLWAIILFLVIGCILERIGIIKPLTMWYREWAFMGSSYENTINNDLRDMNISGFVRPVFFTSEPSLVAIGFHVFVVCLCLIERRDTALLVLVGITVFFVLLMGSPITFFTLFSEVLIYLYYGQVNFKKIISISLSAILLLLVISQIPFIASIYSTIFERIMEETVAEGSSLYARVYFPYFEFLPSMMQKYPWSGLGFGGREKLIAETYGAGISVADINTDFLEGANSFVRIIAYLGIFGTLGLFGILAYYIRKSGSKRVLLFFLLWVIFCQTLGTFETPRFWGYTFMILACFIKIETRAPTIPAKKDS